MRVCAAPVKGSTGTGLVWIVPAGLIHDASLHTGSGTSATRFRRMASCTSCAILDLGHRVPRGEHTACAPGLSIRLAPQVRSIPGGAAQAGPFVRLPPPPATLRTERPMRAPAQLSSPPVLLKRRGLQARAWRQRQQAWKRLLSRPCRDELALKGLRMGAQQQQGHVSSLPQQTGSGRVPWL